MELLALLGAVGGVGGDTVWGTGSAVLGVRNALFFFFFFITLKPGVQ